MSHITKMALKESLKRNIIKKPVNRITISDITNDCGISRMAFYYHFRDIYDLMEWSCVEGVIGAFDGNHTYETWQRGLLLFFEVLLENKEMLQNVFRSVNLEHIQNYLYGPTYDLLYNVVEEKASGMNVSLEQKQFIANFYKFAFSGLMLDWIKNGMQQDYNQIIEWVGVLVDGDVEKALNVFASFQNMYDCG